MRFHSKLSALVAITVGMVGAAQAAVPAALGTALTAMQTDALAVADLGWPVFAAITGAFVLYKIAKKVVSKAT